MENFQQQHVTNAQMALEAISTQTIKFKNLSSQIASAISPEDVWLKLARIDRSTASRPTGISFSDFMSRFASRELSSIFNSVLRTG